MTKIEQLANNLREVLDKHGDRDPDPEGGSLAQLTIAARAILAEMEPTGDGQ